MTWTKLNKSENFTTLLESFYSQAGKNTRNLQSTNPDSDPPPCTTNITVGKKQENPPSKAKRNPCLHPENLEACTTAMPSKSFEQKKIYNTSKSTNLEANLLPPPLQNSAIGEPNWENEAAPRHHQQVRSSAPSSFKFQNPGRQETAEPVPPITAEIGNNTGQQLS